MRTTCFGQKRYIYIYVYYRLTNPFHLERQVRQDFMYSKYSQETPTCHLKDFSISNEVVAPASVDIGTQFFSFQLSPDMFASGLPELGFSSRVKEWGIHQCNKRFKEDTLQNATIRMEIEWCHAPWQGRKKRYQASALHFAHFAHFVASLSSISGRLHTLGIHCDFKTSSRRLKQHETVAPSLLPGLDFYAVSL